MKKVYRDFAKSALCIWVAILRVTLMHITSAEAACDREGPPGKKALIVANGLYETSSGMNALSGAKNDVTLVRQALEARGFAPSDIVIKQDLGYRDFVKALAAFGRSLDCHDHAIVYYSGHGFEIDGKNYLVPVDVDTESETLVKSTSVGLIDVQRALATDHEEALRLVVLDACRNDPFKNKRSMGGRGFQNSSAIQNVTIWYSTLPGTTAADRTNREDPYSPSPFAKAFANVLLSDAACNELSLVQKSISRYMKVSLKSQQRPYTSSSWGGTFYFCKANGIENAPAPVVAAKVEAKRPKLEQHKPSTAEPKGTHHRVLIKAPDGESSKEFLVLVPEGWSAEKGGNLLMLKALDEDAAIMFSLAKDNFYSFENKENATVDRTIPFSSKHLAGYKQFVTLSKEDSEIKVVAFYFSYKGDDCIDPLDWSQGKS
jgi:hypothetical protein